MAFAERKARQALLYVLLDVFGYLRMVPAPPSSSSSVVRKASSLVGAENTARRPAPSSFRFPKGTSPRRFFA